MTKWQARKLAIKQLFFGNISGDSAIAASGGTYSPETHPSPQVALEVPAVNRILSLIGGLISQFEIKVYKRTPNGLEPSSPELARILNNPRRGWTRAELIKWIVRQIVLGSVSTGGSGDAFVRIRFGRDRIGRVRPEYLEPMFQYSVNPIVDMDGVSINYRIRPANSNDGEKDPTKVREEDVVMHDEMLHFKSGIDFNGCFSKSWLQTGMGDTVAALKNWQDYVRQVTRDLKDGVDKAIIEPEGKGGDSTTKAANAAQMIIDMQAARRERVPLFLEGGTTIESLIPDLTKTRLIELHEELIDELGRGSGVPSFLLARENKSTSYGSGLTEIAKSFLLFAIDSILISLQQELMVKFVPSGEVVVFDTKPISKVSLKEFWEAMSKALDGGLTTNEVRDIADYPRITNDPEADRVHRTNTAANERERQRNQPAQLIDIKQGAGNG